MLNFLKLAGEVALTDDVNDKRNFWLGAVAIRKDGAIVKSRNGAVIANHMGEGYCSFPPAHAEARALKKAGQGSILYVARVSRKDRRLALARPCVDCMGLLKAFNVLKCYYTISPYEYGIIDLENFRPERTKHFEENITFA